jgi:hypothetical protein
VEFFRVVHDKHHAGRDDDFNRQIESNSPAGEQYTEHDFLQEVDDVHLFAIKKGGGAATPPFA